MNPRTPQKKCSQEKNPQCMQVLANPPRTPRERGKNLCFGGRGRQHQLPAPSARPQPLPWCRGSHAGVGEQGAEGAQRRLGRPMLAKWELVPLGWERSTHTTSRRGFALRPPPPPPAPPPPRLPPREPEDAPQQHSHMVTALGRGSRRLI